MTEPAFLDELEKRLSQLPLKEIDKHLSYYAGMIDDMTEDGMSEAEAVEKLGPASEIAARATASFSSAARQAAWAPATAPVSARA